MGRQQIKTRIKKISFLAASLLAPVVIAAQASANTVPYFRVSGGNISAGGWFDNDDGTACSTTGNFQASTTTPIKGGILAFVKDAFDPNNQTVGSNGAGVDLAALALGTNTNGSSPNGNYGFF